MLRCQVVAALRQAMTDHGFLEITTLSSPPPPRGARDYLVPARNHPGKFYAPAAGAPAVQTAPDGLRLDRYFRSPLLP